MSDPAPYRCPQCHSNDMSIRTGHIENDRIAWWSCECGAQWTRDFGRYLAHHEESLPPERQAHVQAIAKTWLTTEENA